ncbi:LuxR C-terminal-related transcriptional regulator [Rhodococcus sp. NPDC019627]|uniref:LuxR C-terminal-related transcriptional regulator n=1 Tax=unclassified Rhodococcus (in: high G+C Gram-positive bacteria) TaxID=192944 RepID=UPI0033F521E1
MTKRERQVAALVTEGLTDTAIAARLVISPRTAQGNVEHLLTEIDVECADWCITPGIAQDCPRRRLGAAHPRW